MQGNLVKNFLMEIENMVMEVLIIIKYWGPVMSTFKEYWNLNSKSSILDVGVQRLHAF